jgi:tetratricopeptide (TPR) repeat protein
MTQTVVIPKSVGELLDDCNSRAAELLLTYAQGNYRNFDALSIDRLNLLGGLTWSYRSQRWLTVVDYALVLDAFLDTRGYWEQDKHNLELALEATESLGPGHENRKALLLHDVAVIYMAQGDYRQARTYFERSLALQRQLGDKLAIGRTVHYIGRIHAAEGEHEQAYQSYERSLALAEEIGDNRGMGATLHELGNLYLGQGAYNKAEDYYERSLALSQELEDIRDIATTLHQLGILNHRRGDPDRAQGYFEEALRVRHEIAHQEGIAQSLFALGQLAYDRGDRDEAERLWRESLSIFEHLGMLEVDTVRARLSTLPTTQWHNQDRSGDTLDCS